MKKQFILSLVIVSILILSSFNISMAEDNLASRLKGRILLQVEKNGEAWYVNPADEKRYYMANGDEAYNIMRNLGVGITNQDLERVKVDKTFAKKHSGKIFLQVEENGEAYYIDIDGNAHYLKNGTEAYRIMRELGLGITNNDLAKITINGNSSNPGSNEKNEQEIKDFNKETTNNENQEVYFSVVKVVDGDTVDVDINGSVERLRLIGMDTPETVDPRKPVECFGIEASNKAKELLTNKKVRLLSDNTQDDRDKYGRLLRYLYLEDGTFFNKWMIENGYAHEYTYIIPYIYQSEFKQAENNARANELGLWNPEICNETTSTENNDESNLTENNQEKVIQNTGHIFYTSSYHTSKQYYCDTDSAWKGLSKNYLESYASEAELLAKYPTKILHEPCK